MTVQEKKKELALYRLQQADESIREAILLRDGGSSGRSVMNRIYYAMFYAVLGILVSEPFSSSKHSGVISYFNRELVRSGRFPRELGRALNKAFDARSRGDYSEFADISALEVADLLPLAEEFVRQARAYLQEEGHS